MSAGSNPLLDIFGWGIASGTMLAAYCCAYYLSLILRRWYKDLVQPRRLDNDSG